MTYCCLNSSFSSRLCLNTASTQALKWQECQPCFFLFIPPSHTYWRLSEFSNNGNIAIEWKSKWKYKTKVVSSAAILKQCYFKLIHSTYYAQFWCLYWKQNNIMHNTWMAFKKFTKEWKKKGKKKITTFYLLSVWDMGLLGKRMHHIFPVT